MVKSSKPKIETWVGTLIIGGIIWVIGEIVNKASTPDNDLSVFSWIGRIIGGLVIVVGVYLKVKPKRIRL